MSESKRVQLSGLGEMKAEVKVSSPAIRRSPPLPQIPQRKPTSHREMLTGKVSSSCHLDQNILGGPFESTVNDLHVTCWSLKADFY